MTERDWLTGTHGDALARYWGDRFTERTARLLMLACCQRVRRHFRHVALAGALRALAEHYADPGAPDEPFEGPAVRRAYRHVNRLAGGRVRDPGRGVAFGVAAAVEPLSIGLELSEDLRFLTFSCLHDIAYSLGAGEIDAEDAAQAELVREVLGNVIRPAAFDPAWRTTEAVALARQMYQTQRFAAMPILADALQEAGCDSAAILNHCRDANRVHVRGCWVLDAVLGAR